MLGSGILPALSSTVCQETSVSKVLQEDFVNPSNPQLTSNPMRGTLTIFQFNFNSNGVNFSELLPSSGTKCSRNGY